MKEFLRKFPIVFKGLQAVYRGIIIPIVRGQAIGYPLYYVFIRKNELLKLKNIGFSNIKEFKSKTWRYGVEKDHVFRRYYTALYQGKECFVKIAKNDLTLKNEIDTLYYLNREGFKHMASLQVYDYSFSNNTMMIAVEYIDGLNDFYIPMDDELFDSFCFQFLQILEELNAINVVHADIHRGNLTITKDNRLLLMDFGISKIRNKDNDVNYYNRPGTYYMQDGSIRTYDDAYSFITLIEKLGASESQMQRNSIASIKKRVGLNAFNVKITS